MTRWVAVVIDDGRPRCTLHPLQAQRVGGTRSSWLLQGGTVSPIVISESDEPVPERGVILTKPGIGLGVDVTLSEAVETEWTP